MAALADIFYGSSVYYASPTGRGNGKTAETAGSITGFKSVYKSGRNLILTDGTYSGAGNMLDFTSGYTGLQISALNEGAVIVDGEDARIPVKIQSNDVVITGINACNSNQDVFQLTGESITVRRCIGWNAAQGNYMIYRAGILGLFEDCAGFGIARKIFSASNLSPAECYVTFRRCYGLWEGSNAQGPKMAFTMAYDTRYITIENCIAHWRDSRMSYPYDLVDNEGDDVVQADVMAINQPYGGFAVDNLSGLDGNDAHVNLQNCLVIIDECTDAPEATIYAANAYAITIENLVSYRNPIAPVTNHALLLGNVSLDVGEVWSGSADKLMCIDDADAATVQSQWSGSVTNLDNESSVPGTIYSDTSKANLAWLADGFPLSQRLYDAMTQAGYAEGLRINADEFIESIFGIP